MEIGQCGQWNQPRDTLRVDDCRNLLCASILYVGEVVGRLDDLLLHFVDLITGALDDEDRLLAAGGRVDVGVELGPKMLDLAAYRNGYTVGNSAPVRSDIPFLPTIWATWAELSTATVSQKLSLREDLRRVAAGGTGSTGEDSIELTPPPPPPTAALKRESGELLIDFRLEEDDE